MTVGLLGTRRRLARLVWRISPRDCPGERVSSHCPWNLASGPLFFRIFTGPREARAARRRQLRWRRRFSFSTTSLVGWPSEATD